MFAMTLSGIRNPYIIGTSAIVVEKHLRRKDFSTDDERTANRAARAYPHRGNPTRPPAPAEGARGPAIRVAFEHQCHKSYWPHPPVVVSDCRRALIRIAPTHLGMLTLAASRSTGDGGSGVVRVLTEAVKPKERIQRTIEPYS